MNNDIAIIY